jgi:hypothetical protein
MATNAYGTDFWIGRVFQSKDKREEWRHVVITNMRNGRDECHNLIYGEPKKMDSRGTWISFKTLATRWQNCPASECWCKERNAPELREES